MKINKQQALYTTTPPPPLIYLYKCLNCRYFIQPDDCQIVCRKGLPDLNTIKHTSWCILWMNKSEDKPFSWLTKK